VYHGRFHLDFGAGTISAKHRSCVLFFCAVLYAGIFVSVLYVQCSQLDLV
jgi:hypothetical protein